MNSNNERLSKLLDYAQASGLTFLDDETREKFRSGEYAHYTEIDMTTINQGYFCVGDENGWVFMTIDGDIVDLGPLDKADKDDFNAMELADAVGAPYEHSYQDIEKHNYSITKKVDKSTGKIRYGIICKNGDLIPCRFTAWEPIDRSENVLVADENGKWGVIATNIYTGKMLIENKYATPKTALAAYSKKLAAVEPISVEDKPNEEPAPTAMPKSAVAVSATAVVPANDTTSRINTKVATVTYEYEYSDVKVNGKKLRGIKSNGVQIVPRKYIAINIFNGKFQVQNSEGKWGILDENGDTILPCEYASAEAVAAAYETRLTTQPKKIHTQQPVAKSAGNNETTTPNAAEGRVDVTFEEDDDELGLGILEAIVQDGAEVILEDNLVDSDDNSYAAEEVPSGDDTAREEGVPTVELGFNIPMSIFKLGRDKEYLNEIKAAVINKINQSIDRDEIDMLVEQFKLFVEKMIEAKAKYEQMLAGNDPEIIRIRQAAIDKCEELAAGYTPLAADKGMGV